MHFLLGVWRCGGLSCAPCRVGGPSVYKLPSVSPGSPKAPRMAGGATWPPWLAEEETEGLSGEGPGVTGRLGQSCTSLSGEVA